MNRDNLPWHPAPAAELDWDSGGTPISAGFGDVYFSRDGGPQESRHVFLSGSELPQRWLRAGAGCFTLAETGFGTGLNFLLTWQAWRELPLPRPRLHYLAVEKYPLTTADLERAHAAWPELAPLSRQLRRQYPELLPGQHRLVLEDGWLTLDLWWEDALDALQDLAGHRRHWVDAWYLDGFAPARNETMWQPPLFTAMALASRTGATVATFTAAGRVRRALSDAGFAMEKVPGFGRKRECLRGRLDRRPRAPQPAMTPWDLPSGAPVIADSALVIGGGLAGCHAAAALARRGLRVHLLERADIAAAGSGNDQGVLYTRLSRRHSPLGDFALLSFLYAADLYRRMFERRDLTAGEDGQLGGCLQQSADLEEMATLAPRLIGVPGLARVVDADTAEALLGVPQPGSGYWFPRSGWLHPPAVCRALLRNASIRVQEHCGEIRLARAGDGWQAMHGQAVLARAEVAVVAAGIGCTGFAALDWLPLQAIRGQTTRLPASADTAKLRATLCHEGYIAPARGGAHCIGASFGPGQRDDEMRPAEQRDNLRALAQAVPAWSAHLAGLAGAPLAGRVGYRCASSDYLPLAGPVPDRETFMQLFAPLRHNARQTLPRRGDYLPGLYLSTGHGSRGLCSTPLAAELIASQVAGEPPPLSRQLSRALAPARFLIRDLGRNRI